MRTVHRPTTLAGLIARAMQAFALLVAGWAATTLAAEQPAPWKPAAAPLMTPWAEKIDPASVLSEYPRPVMQRDEWQNLNGLWQFQQASAGDAVPSGKTLSGRILVPFPWESALSGVRQQFESGRAWYRREFMLPPAWKGRRVLLNFGAVDWEAAVYVNGRAVTTHQGGYDAFSVDITPYLGSRTTHEIIVGVYDPGNSEGIAAGKQANDRFTNPRGYSYCPSSGIWQTVWMEPVGPRHITDLHSVPDVDARRVTVTVNADSQVGGLTVEAVVKDGGREVGRASGAPNAPLGVDVPNPTLWTPDTPHLYDLEITLKEGEAALDSVKSYFGMRKIAIRRHVINGRDGLMKIELNDRFLFQMGPLDQGFWPDGLHTAPSDEALRWDIEQIKAFGYNMVRKHIKLEPQRWYYWADKLGLLVWQDMPSTFKKRTEAEKTQFEAELVRMVRTHWNHPSIVNWIVFNEHWGAYDVERLTEMVMALDPSRLVTGNSGMDAGRPHIDYEVGHIKDNHHYRPPTNPMANNRRAAVNGEYGAIGYKAPGHVWDPDGPWVHDSYKGLEDATAEYEKFIGMVVKFRDEDHLSGAVYTQWTDVENEMNGIYTYDRRLVKLDRDRVTQANRSTREPARYNVLFITSDDLRTELGSYGRPVQSPSIDRLAARGARFDRAYAQYPLCNPSRTSMLTGRYPTTTGVLDNSTWFGALDPTIVSLPRHFRANGYVTLRSGKTFHNGIDDDGAWTEGGEPRNFEGARRTPNWQPTPENRLIVLEGNGEKHADYRNATRAIELLEKYRDRPFFLAVGFSKPHSWPEAPQKHYDLYDPATIALPVDFAGRPAAPEGFPRASVPAQNADLFMLDMVATPDEARKVIQAYWASTSFMDEQVGRVLDALDRLGLREKTIVVFLGDNGYHLGEKGKWSKHNSLWEHGTRVPLIVALPGARPQVVRPTVELLDLYPTLTALCGLRPPPGLEGADLSELLRTPGTRWERPAFSVTYGPGRVLGRTVRTDRYRYAEWDEGRQGSFLIDYQSDPHETRNLVADPEYAKVVAEMKQWLARRPAKHAVPMPPQ